MLNLTTALGRNGWQDWILQRVTALFIGLYAVFMLGFWFIFGNQYGSWQILFSLSSVCYATMLVFFAVLAHAWIGLWIVCTDYLKSAVIRLLVLIAIYCALVFYFIWAIQILWGY